MLTLSMKKSFWNEKKWPGRNRLGKKGRVSLASVGKGWIEQLLPTHSMDSQLRVHLGMLRVAETPPGGDRWPL